MRRASRRKRISSTTVVLSTHNEAACALAARATSISSRVRAATAIARALSGPGSTTGIDWGVGSSVMPCPTAQARGGFSSSAEECCGKLQEAARDSPDAIDGLEAGKQGTAPEATQRVLNRSELAPSYRRVSSPRVSCYLRRAARVPSVSYRSGQRAQESSRSCSLSLNPPDERRMCGGCQAYDSSGSSY